jgi:CNT family concentrative nucleoside transporter
MQPLTGLVVLVLIAWLFSERRWQVPWRYVFVALSLQWLLALLLLKLSLFQQLFSALNNLLMHLETATRAGTSFVFGFLGGAELPFEETVPGSSFVLAFRVLPLILVISALSALLFYWRVLPWLVGMIAKGLQKTLGIGGALGLGAAANIFVGMVEAPLFIRPYLQQMSRSELFALMTTGMATIAGTMMVLYASIIGSVIPDAMGHVLTASIISAPAALLLAMVIVPPDITRTAAVLRVPQTANGSMDAITHGTLQGVQLLLNIIAMLVVLVALVALANSLLALLPEVSGQPLSLQRLLGWVMTPLVWLIGIPWSEVQVAAALMGTKTVLNEFLAYLDLAALAPQQLSERSRIIMTYALCGFANLGSLGIMIGGLGTMAPSRRDEIVSLGFKSIAAGTLATLMTAAIVAVIL